MIATPEQGQSAMREVPAPIKGDPTYGSGPVEFQNLQPELFELSFPIVICEVS